MKYVSRFGALLVITCLLLVPVISARARNPVDIYLNGTYISNQVVNVSAGQPLSFQAGFHLAPPTNGETYTTTFQWTIEGNPIKSYTTGTTASWTPLSDPDYRNGTFSCYLLDGGNANVTVAATVTSSIRGTLVDSSMTAGLNVFKPSGINLVPTMGVIGYVDSGGETTLSLGTVDVDPGITITTTGIGPSSPGSFDWVQIVHTFHTQIGPYDVDNLTIDPSLDKQFPYGQSYTHFEDTPQTGYPDPIGLQPALAINFSATTYLIWNCGAPGAIWVPLASLDWSGNAQEESGELYGSQPAYSNIHDTVSLPVIWDGTWSVGT